jgi:hypothetical protein
MAILGFQQQRPRLPLYRVPQTLVLLMPLSGITTTLDVTTAF